MTLWSWVRLVVAFVGLTPHKTTTNNPKTTQQIIKIQVFRALDVWLQPSSTNSQPLTPCYALEYGTKAEMGAQPRVGEASLSF